MDLETFHRLRTPAGLALLEQATQAYAEGQPDPVALSTRLRREFPADLVAAALTQARLRRAGEAKFGADARVMFFSAEGLEQATAHPVAAHRTAGFAAALRPADRVLDLGCGLGGDLIALARAGLEVTGVELDPLTAELARANLEALGLDARVLVADATDVDRGGFAGVLADPARRNARGRVFDPEAYAPPWSFVQGLLADPRAVTCVKTAPIIEHERIESGVTAEWVSLDGDVREAALWSGTGWRPGRRATLLRTGEPPATLTEADDPGEADILELRPGAGTLELRPTEPRPTEPQPAESSSPGRPDWQAGFLYEPDGAVIRAGLVTAVAPLVGGGLLHPRIAYLVSGRLVSTPFARAYRIDDVLTYAPKRLKRLLAERGVGALTVKKRGVDVDPEAVRKRLIGTGGAGSKHATLVLARTDQGTLALLTQPAEARDSTA